MFCCKVLALLAALSLGLLVAVQSCGHHVVHRQIQDLAARHVAQQLHMGSASWGLRKASPIGKVKADTQNSDWTREMEMTDTDGHGNVQVRSKDEASSAEGIHMDAAELELQQWQADRVANSVGSRAAAASDVGNGMQEDGTDPRDELREEESALDPRGRSLQQSASPAPAPIRLSVTYQQLGALDASQQQMLTRVVEAVRRILRKFILVKRPSSGGMLVDPYCNFNTWACYPDFNMRALNPNRECGLATVMPEHIVNPFNCTSFTTNSQRQALGRGISGPASGVGGGASGYGTGCASYAGTNGDDTDMYLYITAVRNDDCESGAAAWAKPCLLDLGNNRPLLGAANVCPRALEVLNEEQLTAVLTHEMIHALGFTDSMYNLTRRPDGTLRPLGELLQSSTVGGKQVQMLVSPKIRDAARAQFSCPDLAGAQLEEEGSAGSAGSHWEYTHYQGEVMVASTTFAADGTPPVLSNLTLSYLDDTGWYVTNRSAAGLLSWGAGAGCLLPNSTCSSYMLAVPGQRLFCDAASGVQSGSTPSFLCSNNYKATGVCRALNFTGGCGLVLSRNAKETCLTADAPNDQPTVFGWGLGTPSGRCLPVVYRFQAYVAYSRFTYPGTGIDGSSDAACFDTNCSADGSKVFVKLLGQQFECPAGKYLNLAQLLPSRYSAGRIGPCPSARDLCSTQSCSTSACNPTGGECLDGTCYCRLAYTGADCGFSLITGQAVTDSGSNDASSGGNGTGNMSPPTLPWVQLVQLALSMNNTASEVRARIVQLQATIASWAGLNRKAVVITNIVDGTRDVPGNSNGTVAGDSFDATVASRRRRGLQQTSSPPPPPVAAAIAMALITPSNSQPIELLLERLRNNETARNQLISQLADTGFFVLPSGISVETVLSQARVTSPPSSESLTTLEPSSRADASRTRKVVIVGLAVGAVAVVGIVSAVITVLVLRSRRSASSDRANVYQHSTAAVRGDFGGSYEFTNLDGFADVFADNDHGARLSPHQPYSIGSCGLGQGSAGVLPWPSANPFTMQGNALWPNGQQGSTTDNPEFSYYSARAATPASSQPPPSQQQYPFSNQHGGMGQLSPLYSGTEDRLRS
ncbi:hypothetical protein VaNZ11_015830 [Volvox africanus]|uniref:EGF-like domain-containing protein n=1 Tax=Volvox africanus TaxID=51714 RepID=A0ABQ5SMG7_9CHLO|nr:hypothetical protein VaNZ11_015830 [Volvox africanus]